MIEYPFHFSYEFDPDRYEGEENSKPEDSTNKSSDEASTGTVIPSSTNAGKDLDKQLSLEVDKHLLTPSPTSLDRSKLKIDLTPDGTEKKKKKKLPPRPEDYDYYWYQDEVCRLGAIHLGYPNFLALF